MTEKAALTPSTEAQAIDRKIERLELMELAKLCGDDPDDPNMRIATIPSAVATIRRLQKQVELAWKKEVPIQPGIYLRNNPPSSYVVRCDVFLIDSDLCVSGEGLSGMRLKNWHGASHMWWFGPIPRPATEQT